MAFAPSSPFDRARFEAGAELIGARYELQRAGSLLEVDGYLAGADAARRVDLLRALEDPKLRALIAARGGYGATRLLPDLPIDAIRRARKWLVGFSDVTALHALWARAGVCSIHGPMVCSLADASEPVRAEWFHLLEGGAPAAWTGLAPIRGGQASGRLFAANLTVLGALVGTPYFPPLLESVLALEDVTERPYRLDRTLTTMLQAGAFQGVRAIVLGQFTQCDPAPDGRTADDVLRERLATLDVPIVAAAPFGHIGDNRPLLLGALAHVDGDRGEVRFEET